MRIIVDADACPGKAIIEKTASKYSIPVIMFCDLSHILSSTYSTIRYVESGFQSVDMAVANETKAGDIIVTQDYGVAAMVLGKNAFAINPKGFIYDQSNIDRLLFERHIAQKVRKSGGRTANHKKRSSEDDERLLRNLELLIKNGKNEDC